MWAMHNKEEIRKRGRERRREGGREVERREKGEGKREVTIVTK